MSCLFINLSESCQYDGMAAEVRKLIKIKQFNFVELQNYNPRQEFEIPLTNLMMVFSFALINNGLFSYSSV